MKVITYILAFIPFLAFSQDKPLMATCEYVNGILKIRWVPTDFETWQRGITEGYTLERFTESESGIVNTLNEVQTSKEELLSQVKPLDESDWIGANLNSDFAQVIKEAIYYTEQNPPTDPNAPKFGDAVYAQETAEARHLFSLFAAEQDFEASVAAGWGHEDADILPNSKYFYRVSIGDDIKAICIVDTSQDTNFPKINDVESTGQDSTILLNWRINDLDQRYSAFDIERSSDGINFEAVNEMPFVFMNSTEEEIEFAMYVDSLAQNGVAYDYQIRGITPFGTRGTPSDIVTSSGIADRILELSFAITEAVISGSNVDLTWNPLSPEIQSQIVEWKVLRATHVQGDYETLSTSSAEIITYQDTDPQEQGYYIVELTDENGHIYRSPNKYVQLEDNTPPETPTGLAAEFVTGTDIRITWDENAEEDLAGYYIYASNGMNAYFSTIHADIIGSDAIEYIHQIKGDFIVDNIYYTIVAQDSRGNLSAESAPIEIPRPDIIPPSSPDIYKIQPLPDGIGIGWKFSDSDDVSRHELQRKISTGPNWEVILDIPIAEQDDYLEDLTPGSLTSICYLDTAALESRSYDYRMLAFDEAGNVSNSKPISAIPIRSKIVGEIQNFRKTNLQELTPPSTPQVEAWDAMNDLIAEYQAGNPNGKDGTMSDLQTLVIFSVIRQDEMDELLNTLDTDAVTDYLVERRDSFWAQFTLYELTLSWDYENMDQLSGVKIYRSRDGGELIDYDMTGITDVTNFMYVDTDIKLNSDYLYQITMLHEGGQTSEKSEVLYVRVQ